MTRWLPLFAVLTLAACANTADDSAREPDLDASVPLPECPDADYTTCDIRDAKCQARFATLAACLRGNAAPPDVPVEVMTEAQYADVIRQDYAEVPEPSVKHFDKAISKFGLAPPAGVPREDDIQARVADIAGVYRGSEKRIVIVDRGKAADSISTDLTLVHEFIHALQDADHDLSHWPDDDPRTFDAALARSTVIEGEASFYQYRAAVPLLGLDIAEVDFESALQEHLDYTLGQLPHAPLQLSQSFLTVPYGIGALLMFHAWQDDGPSGIDPIWATPLRAMQPLMSQVFGRNAPADANIDFAEPDALLLRLYGDDVLGAWGLNLVLQHQLKSQDTVAQALSWRGDHFWVYTDDGEHTYALWQLELESVDAAQALDEFFASFPRLIHETAGARVFVTYGMDGFDPAASLTEWGRAWLLEP